MPVIVYSDLVDGKRATAKKFDGTTWQALGSIGFSADRADCISLAVNRSGTPYVVYCDYGNGFKATVMKFTAATGCL